MAANFMATPRMRLLRFFIENEDFTNVNWHLVEGNDLSDSGTTNNLDELLQNSLAAIEVYLSPYLATIVRISLGDVSDKKINDEFLLGAVEDNLAEDVENCKPILMRMSDGNDFVAVLNRFFYQTLLGKLVNQVKQVRFIQPFPYATHYEEGLWTVYMLGSNKFIRTSSFEYFLLDDTLPIPDLLDQLLSTYTADKLILYAEDPQVGELIKQKYALEIMQYAELSYGVASWNFYNEKSKIFNIKLNDETRAKIFSLSRYAAVYGLVFVIFWLINLGYLMVNKSLLEQQISSNLDGIVTTVQFNPNLLAQVDEKIADLEHDKGLYASSDALSLFSTFLKSMPQVSNNMIQGLQYSGSQLKVFLNSQFDPVSFPNNKNVFASKRIDAEITDYKTYQASLDSNDSKNNGGGVLSNTDSKPGGAAASLSEVAWVITLQLITRMETYNDNKKF